MTKAKAGERACPKCAEPIKLAAIRCKHCGHDLSPDEVEAGRKMQNAKGAAGCLVVAALILLVGYCTSSGSSPEETAKEDAAAAEDKKKGFHCLSPWDGSSTQLVTLIKAQLRDPDSFEHDETRITPVDADGMHSIAMDYRAKNGFGGVNRGTAFGEIKNADCSAALTSSGAD